MAKEGWPFFCLSSLASFFLIIFFPPAGFFSLVIPVFIAFFFRDPNRTVPENNSFFLSPADGRVTGIEKVLEAGKIYHKITIFLSLLDVHITRSPVAGRVVETRHTPGLFLAAYRREAPGQNESNRILIENERNTVIVRQIAGKIARRIVCYCKAGDALRAGQKIGIIRFGSCVQIYLPERVALNVQLGEKVKGGLTILGSTDS